MIEVPLAKNLIGAAGVLALAACSFANPTSAVPYQGAGGTRAAARPGTGRGYRELYSFGQDGKRGDGRTPLADLAAVGGTFYGTTEFGGKTDGDCSVGCGTIFSVTPTGAERVLYRFRGGRGGAEPVAGVVAAGGALYGTTSAGGSDASCAGGCGTVFRSDTHGHTRVTYRFEGGEDGAEPFAGLTKVNGAFYGTTLYGGGASKFCPKGCGTIFRLNSNGKSEHVLYAFKGGSDGSQPTGAIVASGGELYGTTQYGGGRTAFCAIGCGTVFRINADGKGEKVLHSFRFAPHAFDGAYPSAGVVAVGGVLYGTTFGGGSNGDGTVFLVHPSSGEERVIHTFACCNDKNDGKRPFGRLINVNGTLYGTTRNGGNFKGTVFKITTSGEESVLYNFAGKPDGAWPEARLTAMNATLYGTTSSGGNGEEGTIFALMP